MRIINNNWNTWKIDYTLYLESRAGPSLRRVRQLPKAPNSQNFRKEPGSRGKKKKKEKKFQMNYKNNLADPFNQKKKKKKKFGKSY